MNVRFSLGFFVALCGAWLMNSAAGAAQSCANLVTNGDFSSNCAGWEEGGITCEYGDTQNYLDVVAGNTAVEIDAGDDGLPPQKTLKQTVTGLIIGKTYLLSMRAARRTEICTPPDPVDADVTFTGTDLGTHNISRGGSGGFSNDTVTFVATATSGTLTVAPGALNNDGCGVIIDDISVTATCDDGLGCTNDVCVSGTCQATVFTGCAIDGMCIPEGDTKPGAGNECLVCDSAQSKTEWSPVAQGTACLDGGNAGQCNGSSSRCCAGCWDGNVCRAGTTTADCGGGGDACDDCRDANDCTDNACTNHACDITNNTDDCNDGDACTLQDKCSNGACGGTEKDCNDNLSCTIDSCNSANGNCGHAVSTGCVIDGECRTAGALNPEVECQYCNPGESETAWTTAPPGDDGGICMIPDAGVPDAGPDGAVADAGDGDGGQDDGGNDDGGNGDGGSKADAGLSLGHLAGGGGLCAMQPGSGGSGAGIGVLFGLVALGLRRRRR